jgi:hypothetical protein
MTEQTPLEIHTTLNQLPDFSLRDLARNDGARLPWRKMALKILRERQSPFALYGNLDTLIRIAEAKKG